MAEEAQSGPHVVSRLLQLLRGRCTCLESRAILLAVPRSELVDDHVVSHGRHFHVEHVLGGLPAAFAYHKGANWGFLQTVCCLQQSLACNPVRALVMIRECAYDTKKSTQNFRASSISLLVRIRHGLLHRRTVTSVCTIYPSCDLCMHNVSFPQHVAVRKRTNKGLHV
jgi:hypothetical protein